MCVHRFVNMTTKRSKLNGWSMRPSTLFGEVMAIVLRNHVVVSGVASVNKEMFNIILDVAQTLKWALPFPPSFMINNLGSIELKQVYIPASAFAACCGLKSLCIPCCWIAAGEELNFNVVVDHLNITGSQRIHRVNDNIKTLIAANSDLKKLPLNATIIDIDGCEIDYSGPLPTGLIGIKCDDPPVDLMHLIRLNSASLTSISIPRSANALGNTLFPQLEQYDYSYGIAGLPNAPGLHKLACKGMRPSRDLLPPTKLQLANYPDLEWLDIYDCDLSVYLETAPGYFPQMLGFLQLDMERERHLLELFLPSICPFIMVYTEGEFVVVDPLKTVLSETGCRPVYKMMQRIGNGGGWFIDEPNFGFGDDDTGVVFFPY